MSLLPPSTNDAYRGARISAWYLALAAVLTIAPALVHLTLPDGGAQSIAHLDLGDRRALVVAVFRWEGATQLALGLAMLGVALRYRPLTPIFLALNVLERGLMALDGWVLEPPASGQHPPEHFGSVGAVALGLVFLALSLRPRPA
ncbi:hypothetical protein ACO2Q3_02865 [Caulobacter sp. KR2-114]|uniref:hypothetical protein n=1 Tax=Caulobacter sp. KR2-114 TaxID=3400912 RepID=UPI003C0C1762